jgi:DNA-binding response OmpR family regulator
VNANATAASKVAKKLIERGFPTDIVSNCPAASAVATGHHYGAVVVISDFRRASEVQGLISLRLKLPRTWIVAVSNAAPSSELELTLRYFADALVTPLSVEELAFRLGAFSLRSRPP